MTKENLAKQLKHYRFAHGYTQARMAAVVGVSLHTIQRIEADNGYKSSELTLFKIDQLLNPKEKGHAA